MPLARTRIYLQNGWKSRVFSSIPKTKRQITDEESAAMRFSEWLGSKDTFNKTLVSGKQSSSYEAANIPSQQEWRRILQASMATFALHVTSRVFALEGRAFYTIGPCGEEFAAVWGSLLEDKDSCALHYRHLASQIARQLKQGKDMQSILRDRARGYVCSSLDPVTGGRHCALGGGPNDFYVTSTLASQAPSAVGRALGGALLGKDETIHFVSFGDGSVTNAQFLAAKNLAENAAFRGIRCPILFCITDNDISISLKGQGWIEAFSKTFLMPVIKCDGKDILSVYDNSKVAFETVRKSRKPAVLIVKNVNRRFGHAATDRQLAYFTQEEINTKANDNSIMESIVSNAVSNGAVTFPESQKMWKDMQAAVQEAFEEASKEPKLDSVEKIASANAASIDTSGKVVELNNFLLSRPEVNTRMTMRKCMTKCIEEEMIARKNMVYLGEDVRHGGYYLVTDGLANKFGGRIIDFPPDETTLIGCAQGFSQRGLLPVVEIPYLKYLDCGADQFFELAITHWCTNGKQRHGAVLRLQGFDRGVFGGNFHTHNSLYMPPGVDFLCFSNGRDWARGFHAALEAAEQGRIVAIVDPTHALNKRHVEDGDDAWLSEYPSFKGGFKFEDVFLYKDSAQKAKDSPKVKRMLIVTYGNGVPDAILVQKQFASKLNWQIDVVDVPLISSPPATLKNLLKDNVDAVIFADCCKPGQNPFAGFVQRLGQNGLPKQWVLVSASETYNPLSRTETFLSPQRIYEAIRQIAESS